MMVSVSSKGCSIMIVPVFVAANRWRALMTKRPSDGQWDNLVAMVSDVGVCDGAVSEEQIALERQILVRPADRCTAN